MNSKIPATFILICLTAISISCMCQTRLTVDLNKTIFKQADTLNFELKLTDSFRTIKTATVHLWIENINNGRKWHYKYPLVNGFLNARIFMDSTLPDGDYAMNFLLQKKFFRIKGRLENALKNEHQIHYVLLSRNKEFVTGDLLLDMEKSFVSEYMLFQDTACIVFSGTKRRRILPQVHLTNEVDSPFVALDTVTKIISIIGDKNSLTTTKTNHTDYRFSLDEKLYKTIMPEVVVNAKTKKIIDDFQKDNVSGLFSGADGIVIDGLESDEIANASDLFNFLTGKIAGLIVKTKDDGAQELKWRNHHTDIYLDEIKVDSEMALTIATSDIAMIKIFEPGVQVSFGSGAGGTIAIYLKNGNYKKDNKPTNNFRIMGYTGLDAVWK